MEIKLRRLGFLVIALGMLVTASCKKESRSVSDYPVVVGYLVAGEPVTVKLYRQKDLTDTATYGDSITALKLSISDGSKSINLTESPAGVYTYADRSFVSAGKTYQVRFSYLGNEVSASTTIPKATTGYSISTTTVDIQDETGTTPGKDSLLLTLNWNNPDSLYHVLVIRNTASYLSPIQSRMQGPANFTINAGKVNHYALNRSSISYYGDHEAILYTVEKIYLDILQPNSNTTSQKLSDPPGNILNGFGIFTGMQADTLRFTVVRK